MSGSNCCFLTRIQISQEIGKVVWYFKISLRIFHSLLWFTQSKTFSLVNAAKRYIFLDFVCFLFEPTNVGNLISGSSAFAESTLYLWKFLGHALSNPSLKDFEYNLTSMWNEDSCQVAWTFFSTALLLGLGWKLIFSSPVITAEFSKFAGRLSAALSQHHLSGFEIAQLEFHHLH